MADKYYNFITTKDAATRDALLLLGFVEVPSGGDFFQFVNNSTLKFDDSIKMDKVGFSNKLWF